MARCCVLRQNTDMGQQEGGHRRLDWTGEVTVKDLLGVGDLQSEWSCWEAFFSPF